MRDAALPPRGSAAPHGGTLQVTFHMVERAAHHTCMVENDEDGGWDVKGLRDTREQREDRGKTEAERGCGGVSQV